MPNLRRVKKYMFGTVLSSLPLMLGSYVIYEKALLAIMTGQTEGRDYITERAFEPVSFWMSVITFFLCGCVVAFFGVWGLWQTFKPRKPSDR